ncbi:hypothetical protein CKA38_02065 [Ereboglobus luteus]|uniref:Trigger factor C-terminal domain-containing protein n=2 Tax=Ereboglobus luteus TaxID=1796921 RepID=A0A2U8E078_9BACT|nr:hypothetical protein CKA38_02065 [Ereboglobus luteus]
MYTSFMQVTPGCIRITLEAAWSTAASDYAEACALYRDIPVPGFSPGEVPAIITANCFSREIRAETIRRCASRLIRSVLVEKGIRTVGPLLILQASLEPGEKFVCTIELLLRPEVALPDCENFEPVADCKHTRRTEAREWLVANTECTVPEPIIRKALNSTHRDIVQPGSKLWDEAEHNALLHIIAHEVADRHGITVSEERLEEHLRNVADTVGMSPAKLRAAYNKNGQIEVIRESLLIEAVLDFLTKQEEAFLAQESAIVA